MTFSATVILLQEWVLGYVHKTFVSDIGLEDWS